MGCAAGLSSGRECEETLQKRRRGEKMQKQRRLSDKISTCGWPRNRLSVRGREKFFHTPESIEMTNLIDFNAISFY